MTGRTACLVVMLGALPCAVRAQVPAGPEFQINSYTYNTQAQASVATDARGNFVVAWASYRQDGSAWGIFGQRFSAAGAPLAAEFRINTHTPDYQFNSSVASDARGNFVVVWESWGDQDGYRQGVFGQRFNAAGARLGTEFQVNTFTTSDQSYPSTAADASGKFVVVWQSYYQDGGGSGVFGQRFSGAGATLGTEFLVNTFTPGDQSYPSIASNPSGDFVVVWESFGQDGSGTGIFGQRFSAAGATVGAEFRVNTFTPNNQSNPSVASDPNGNFVVVWESLGQDGSGAGVFGQRFSAAGATLGPEFRVNTFTTDQQRWPSLASDASGNFAVTWGSLGQDGSLTGVFGQRFSATGATRGAEFRINTFIPRVQDRASVASDAHGNFVVAWHSEDQDGGPVYGAFGQRFGGLRPAALVVDTAPLPGADGNGVLEPGESTDARPSWSNANGVAQTFGGTFSSIVGPSGATYALADPNADYGTLGNGATRACLDCYGIGVSAPPARPVLHWDASVLETITPAAHGQTERWRLHIGDTFTDVPRTSPFYRYIETLLHYDITGGCGGSSYCPGAATSREQMAVFVLVAKEGPGYVPLACVAGSEAFADVPASNPFCRWIEELARRGIVSGCGGGNYCPGNTVVRDQMAVFVLRTVDSVFNPPACGATPMFPDVPTSSPFCRWVEDLARRGIVSGCGGGNYCPGDGVTREQMGVFISATFGLALYGP